MKLLTFDIETSPNIGHLWGLFNQTISLAQLRESTRVISFAAKWHGKPRVEFRSEFHDGAEAMLKRAYELLSEADAVIHYNGQQFDVKHFNREFGTRGWGPPAPFEQIDLLRVVRKNFRFPSNKLQHVSTEFGLEGKTGHEGHGLWVRCLAGEAKAWSLMKRYNIQDVRLTEKLYDKLLPWIQPHPSLGLYDQTGMETCPNCGSTELESRGFAYTTITRYRRFRCADCGKWTRSGKSESRVDIRGVAA